MAIWLDQALHPNKPIYNTGLMLRIPGPVDPDCFARAVEQVVAESDALRLRFFERDGDVLQAAMPFSGTCLQVKDFAREADPEAAAAAWVEQTFWKPIRPTDFPLFNFTLLKLAPDRFLWLQRYHHLIIDATGRQLVAARAAAVYNAVAAGREPPPVEQRSYRIAFEAEDQYLASARYAADRAYWLRTFADVPEPLVRTGPHCSEKFRSGRPARAEIELGPDALAGLRACARRNGTTIFKVIVCLTWCCFSRIYAAPDLTMGMAIGNRPDAKSKHLVGMFSKVMPFRPRLSAEATFADVLTTVDRGFSECLKHQRFPVDHINRDLNLRRRGRHGLFDVTVNYVRSEFDFRIGDAPVTPVILSSAFFLPWCILLSESGPDDLRVLVDYDPGRIGTEEADRLLQGLRLLLGNPPADQTTVAQLLPGMAPAARAVTEAPQAAAARPAARRPPRDELERVLLEIWQDCIGQEAIGIGDNFFETGGDSLKGIRLIGKINARFGLHLPVTALFAEPTVEQLAEAVRRAERGEVSSCLFRLKPGSDATTLILFHPVGGSLLCYGELIARLPATLPVYGLQAAGTRPDDPLPDSIEAMASAYLKAIDDAGVEGEWHLAGWSFGGAVAFEMAWQLQDLGRPAASLTLIDSMAQRRTGGDPVPAAVAGIFDLDAGALEAGNGETSLAAAVNAGLKRAGRPAIAQSDIQRVIDVVAHLIDIRERYHPRRLPGGLTLIRAAAEPNAHDADFDWGPLVEGRVRLFSLPATHASIVTSPHVAEVATILTDAIRGDRA